MNRKELISALVTKSGESRESRESRESTAAVLAALPEVVLEEVQNKGGTIRLTGFGTFTRKDMAARTARNPRTGESIEIPAKQKTVFKFSKTFGE